MAKLKSGTRIYGTATIDTSVVVGSAVTLSSSGIQVTGISTLNNANATQLQVTGVSTFTNGPVLVGSATSSGTASQRLQVTGGGYVSGSVGIGVTNPQYILTVSDTGTPATVGLTNCLADFTTTANSYGQINLRNTSTGTNASSDIVLTADTGNDSSNFIDLGINNSGFSVGSWTINGATDGYLYTSDGNLSIGAINASVAKYISFFTGGTLISNERMRVNATGVGIGTINPTVNLQLSPTADISNVGFGITLAGTVGSALTVAQFVYANNNASRLRIKATRNATGSDWTSASTKLVNVTDVTEQAYIEFNPLGSQSGGATGLAFGNGATEWARFNASGNIGIGTTRPTSKLQIQGDALVSGIVTATSFSGGGANLTSGSFSSQITSTQANSTTTGGGQIYLNGATGNRIDFNTNGITAPTLTTRGAGTKIVLYPQVSASSVDYAIGIDNNTLWNSVDTSASSFKWYAGTTNIATLSGAGNLSVTGTVTGTNTYGYSIPDTSETSSYILLGTWTTGQGGYTLYINVVSHQGFNADTTQNQVTRLYFKTSNGSSNTGGFYGDALAYREVPLGSNNGSPASFRIVQVSTSSYAIYGSFSTYTSGSTYQLQYPSYTTWTHSGTLVAAPTGTYIDVTPTSYANFSTFSDTVTLTTVPFFRNTPTIASNYTVTTSYNEMSIGPITINNGITVTVNSGATWTVV